MKKMLIKKQLIQWLLVGLVGSSFTLNHQSAKSKTDPCQKVEIIKTEAEKKVMDEVIAEWKGDRYFIADRHLNYKGVVCLLISKDSDGRKRWGLIPWIADNYRGNPPAKYSVYNGTIILIYENGQDLNPLAIKEEIEERNRCLNEIIGDRLYINPPPTPHLHPREMVEITINGNKRMVEKKIDMLGNSGADYWVIFNKDGTYVKTPMA